MIALEMIGYYDDAPNSQEYPDERMKWFYPNTGDFIAVVGRLNEFGHINRLKKSIANNTTIKVVKLVTPIIFPGIDFSDHQSYWLYKYPAVMVTDTAYYRNKNYHKETDAIETLNFDKMADVTKGVFCYLATL
jgi:hypothetical protein